MKKSKQNSTLNYFQNMWKSFTGTFIKGVKLTKSLMGGTWQQNNKKKTCCLQNFEENVF